MTSVSRSVPASAAPLPVLTPATLSLIRRDPGVRAIVRSHRRLTAETAESACEVLRDKDRHTLIACSAGCDSTALALALRCTSVPLTLAHVVHDMRPECESLADRDHARALAESLGAPFVEARVTARSKAKPASNLEANARRARYAALIRLACEHGCRFIATGHHADDVLETLLMRLMRGAGPRGLAGPVPARNLASGIWLVRPMLTITRADAERICSLAGLPWRHDATNDDAAHLRNALRARVLPILRELAPGVERRASHTAFLLRQASDLIASQAADLLPAPSPAGILTLSRARLRAAPVIVSGAALRHAIAAIDAGTGLDRVTAREMTAAVRAIRDARGDVRTFRWGRGGCLAVTIDARSVTITTDGAINAGKADRARRTLRP